MKREKKSKHRQVQDHVSDLAQMPDFMQWDEMPLKKSEIASRPTRE